MYAACPVLCFVVLCTVTCDVPVWCVLCWRAPCLRAALLINGERRRSEATSESLPSSILGRNRHELL